MTSTIEELVAENTRLKAAAAAPIATSGVTVYIVAVVVLCMSTVAGVIALTIVRPTADNTPVITQLVGITIPIALALLGGALQQTRTALDGRLTQLLGFTAAAAHAEGKLEGTTSTPRVTIVQTDQVGPVVVGGTRSDDPKPPA